jgi:predicted transcriptional regulator
MGEATYTFRIDEALKAEVDAAAKASNLTADELIRFMIIRYLENREQMEYDAWFAAEVKAGIAEADAGDVIPHEEVEAEAAAWRAEIRRKLAASNS